MLENVKNFIKKHRPDQQKFMIGDGSHTLKYKIRKNKIELGYDKQFEDGVTITVTVESTGDVFNFKRERGLNAKFQATTRF